MHENQTKLEKNITCKEEKQGTSSKRSKRNKEIEHLGDSSVFFFHFLSPHAALGGQQSAIFLSCSVHLVKGP